MFCGWITKGSQTVSFNSEYEIWFRKWLCVSLRSRAPWITICIQRAKRGKDNIVICFYIENAGPSIHSQYWYFIWEWKFHSITAAMGFPSRDKITGGYPIIMKFTFFQGQIYSPSPSSFQGHRSNSFQGHRSRSRSSFEFALTLTLTSFDLDLDPGLDPDLWPWPNLWPLNLTVAC